MRGVFFFQKEAVRIEGRRRSLNDSPAGEEVSASAAQHAQRLLRR